jgi:hypothetical protein
MGNVRLYGSTSGYTELAPPAVAGDNTLTLPANGFGKVLQVVSATYATNVSTTSTSFVTTGLTGTITPSSATSKIMVFINSPFRTVGSAGNVGYATVYRGTVAGTNLGLADGFGSSGNVATGETKDHPFSISILDSPATTSATTYTFAMRSSNASFTVSTFMAAKRSTMTLMEISA